MFFGHPEFLFFVFIPFFFVINVKHVLLGLSLNSWNKTLLLVVIVKSFHIFSLTGTAVEKSRAQDAFLYIRNADV